MADAAKDSVRLSGFRLSPELIAIVTMGLMLGVGMFNLSGRIDNLRIEVRAEIQALRTEMNEKFAQLRAEMNEKFAQLRAEMNEKFSQLRAEMNEKFAQRRAETNGQFGQRRTETTGQFAQLRAEIRGLRTEIREDRLALRSADENMRRETGERFLSVEDQLQILQSALIRPPATLSSKEDAEPEARPTPGTE